MHCLSSQRAGNRVLHQLAGQPKRRCQIRRLCLGHHGRTPFHPYRYCTKGDTSRMGRTSSTEEGRGSAPGRAHPFGGRVIALGT